LAYAWIAGSRVQLAQYRARREFPCERVFPPA
jgi:hypothetical protein